MLPGSVGAKSVHTLYSDHFPISDVKLLDGPLKHAMDLNVKVLLEYDTDRLVAPMRAEAGLEKKAEYFPNWAGLDGHVVGHYVTALALAYANTGNSECLHRLEYIIDEFDQVAKANSERYPDWGRGYIGGVPNGEAIWSNMKRGDFSHYHRAWVPFYNIHKTYAGLRDAWVYCGIERAKSLFLGLCDWGIELTSTLSDEQMESILAMEHGGMNEVYADAYAITGNEKYLTAAKRFSHKALMNPLSNDEDRLDNMHANTQVPKAIGFARVGELSGDATYLEAGRFFWQTVTSNRSLAFGGNSRREHFPSHEASFDFVTEREGPETCNTYNMLKLTENLFRVQPMAEYADYYERAMFNHILSTQHPEHGGYVYFTPARPRHYRVYSDVNQGMWCCVGSGMENHVKYNHFIYTKSGNNLYVNLFLPSTLTWREKRVSLKQETQFPYSDNTTITITKGRGHFALMIRYPGWVKNGEFQITINGEKQQISADPSSYVALERKWKRGDVITITTPMHPRVEHMCGVDEYIAIMYGPILLGMKSPEGGLRGLIADDGRWAHIASGEQLPIADAPMLINSSVDKIADYILPIEGKPLHFTFSGNLMISNPIEGGELEPFFSIHDSRYVIYWLADTPSGYVARMENLQSLERERLELERRSLDAVAPGEQQPEADHKMRSQRASSGVNRDLFYRRASAGGWFSYELATQGQTEDISLYLRLFGDDTTSLLLYVDDFLLQQVDASEIKQDGKFYGVEFEVPSSLLQGREYVRVKVESVASTQSPAVYGLRLLKR